LVGESAADSFDKASLREKGRDNGWFAILLIVGWRERRIQVQWVDFVGQRIFCKALSQVVLNGGFFSFSFTHMTFDSLVFYFVDYTYIV
jgi:hypothetical protein